MLSKHGGSSAGRAFLADATGGASVGNYEKTYTKINVPSMTHFLVRKLVAKINANLEERRKMKNTLLSIKVRQTQHPKWAI